MKKTAATKSESPEFNASFKEAEKLALSNADQAKVTTLQEKIPADIQGLFQLMIHRNDTTNELYGLRVQGDPALAACFELNKTLGTLRGREAQHGPMRHGNHLSIEITGSKFEKLISSEREQEPEDARKKFAKSALKKCHREDNFTDCQDSIPLSGASKFPNLSQSDRTLAERVAAAIPEDLRGAFAFNIAVAGGKPTIEYLILYPQMPLNIINKSLGIQNYDHPHRFKVFAKTDLEGLTKALPNPGRSNAI